MTNKGASQSYIQNMSRNFERVLRPDRLRNMPSKNALSLIKHSRKLSGVSLWSSLDTLLHIDSLCLCKYPRLGVENRSIRWNDTILFDWPRSGHMLYLVA